MLLALYALVCLVWSPLARVIATPINATTLTFDNDDSTSKAPLNTTLLNETEHVSFKSEGFVSEALFETVQPGASGFNPQDVANDLRHELHWDCPDGSYMRINGMFVFYILNVQIRLVVSSYYLSHWSCAQLRDYLEVLQSAMAQMYPHEEWRRLELTVQYTPEGQTLEGQFASLRVTADEEPTVSTNTNWGDMEVYVMRDHVGSSGIDTCFREVQRELADELDEPVVADSRVVTAGVVFRFQSSHFAGVGMTNRQLLGLVERSIGLVRARAGMAREYGFGVGLVDTDPQTEREDPLFSFAPVSTLVLPQAGNSTMANATSLATEHGIATGLDTFA